MAQKSTIELRKEVKSEGIETGKPVNSMNREELEKALEKHRNKNTEPSAELEALRKYAVEEFGIEGVDGMDQDQVEEAIAKAQASKDDEPNPGEEKPDEHNSDEPDPNPGEEKQDDPNSGEPGSGEGKSDEPDPGEETPGEEPPDEGKKEEPAIGTKALEIRREVLEKRMAELKGELEKVRVEFVKVNAALAEKETTKPLIDQINEQKRIDKAMHDDKLTKTLKQLGELLGTPAKK